MVSPVLSAILTALATAGLIGLTAKQSASGDTTIFNSEGQPIINLPESVLNFTNEIPLSSVRCNLVRVSGITTTSKPATSQIKLTNLTKNNRLLKISVIPDPAMQTSGALEIETNGSTLLSIAQSALTDLTAFDIPISNEGLLLNDNTTIEFFGYSPTGAPVAFTALILTGVK